MVRVHRIFQVFEICGEHEELVQRLRNLLVENTAANVEQSDPYRPSTMASMPVTTPSTQTLSTRPRPLSCPIRL